jgi:uncharacterized protein (TIGR03067 family)
MKKMKLAGLCAGLALLAAVSLTQAQSPEPGFVSLFNGSDLTGWDGNPKLWSVKDGAITGQTTAQNPAKGNTFLIWTKGTVGDFELRCSFRLVPGSAEGFANSGIQYRSKVVDPANWVVGGYQADMEAGPNYSGILYEERFRGIMAERGEKVVWGGADCKKQVVGSVGSSADIQSTIRKGDWNDYVIIAQGNHLRQFINGKQTVDVVDDCEAKRAMSGILALQLHAGPPMMVQFKNLRLKQSGDELANMQGAWKIAAVEADGNSVPSESLESLSLTITGNSYLFVNNDEKFHGTLTLDSSKQPKQMDIHPTDGPDAGQTMLGIYETGPGALKICYGQVGKPRPDAFKSEPDSGRIFVTYKKDTKAKKIVFVAGPPSHGPREHEHRAGCLLLQSCLEGCPGVTSVVYSNGWPQNPSEAFAGADTVVVYSDGGGGHPLLQGDHLQVIGDLVKKGVGLVCIHYAVEPTKEKGQTEFLDWIGGAFEVNHSVNPTWTADFKELPKHPITSGVHPFKIYDEWYFFMRFRDGMSGVTPILSAVPPASTMDRKDGPHEGNPEVREAVKRGDAQHMAWACERADGGRGFGFTGAHYHKNWGNDDFRRLVLNAILWTAHMEVPADGLSSQVSEDDLKKNLDPK